MPTSPIPLVRSGIDREKTTLSEAKRCLGTHWFCCLLLLLAGIFVRSPALQGERIWDDLYLSHDNLFIKSPLLVLETFRHYLFLDSFSAHYRPLQNISFMVDYFFWNTNEFGFHLTNVLLHVGSGILLYFLLRNVFASLYLRNIPLATRDRFLKRTSSISHVPFLLALIWTLHPVHRAAVDYISGRADSLAFFFAAEAWLLFFQARRVTPPLLRNSLYVCAALGGLLALLSREIAVVWIALFLAHLFFVERGLSLRLRATALLCCFVVIMTYVGLRQLPQQRVNPITQDGWRSP